MMLSFCCVSEYGGHPDGINNGELEDQRYEGLRDDQGLFVFLAKEGGERKARRNESQNRKAEEIVPLCGKHSMA